MSGAGPVFTELPPGTILAGRYAIRKVLAFDQSGGVYLARDQKITDKEMIIKEIIPSPRLEESELEERRRIFEETVEVIMHFDYRGLSKVLEFFSEANREYVVLEYVEGVTLKEIMGMSLNSLPEPQILDWVIQIADAIHYMHDRPIPFIFEALEPSHIILNQQNEIKLINYGLDRYFNPDTPVDALSAGEQDLGREIKRFGETLASMITGLSTFDAAALSSSPNASEELKKLVQKTLFPEPEKTFGSVFELRQELEKILHPPPPKAEAAEALAVERPVLFPTVKKILPSKQFWQDLLHSILSQKVSYFFAEVAALIVLVLLILILGHPGWNYTKAGPVMACLCKAELWIMEPGSFRLLDRVRLPGEAGGIEGSRNGMHIYVAIRSGNRMMVIDTLHDTLSKEISVDPEPSKLLQSMDQKYLYCLHEKTSNVSQISVAKGMMVNIMATAGAPRDMVLSEDQTLLYVSSSRADSISVLKPLANVTLRTVTVSGGAGPLAMDPNGRDLLVCNPSTDSITLLDPLSLEVREVISGVGVDRPSAMCFSLDGRYLFIANAGSNTVTIVDSESRKTLGSVRVGKEPADMDQDPQGRLWVVNHRSHNISIIDPRTRSVEMTVNVGSYPVGIRLIP